MTLVVLFVVVLVTGVILHLKKHGIIIEPRPLIKTIHWLAGLGMVTFACWHGMQFSKMLGAMKKKFKWFWADTWIVIAFTVLAFATGIIKLLSPVKIPGLDLWHYWMGMIMSAAIIVHLFRGLPSWNRLRKIKPKK